MPRWGKTIDLELFRRRVSEQAMARDIAVEFGVSRQRIYQVAKNEGLKLYVPIGRPWARGKRTPVSILETGGLVSELSTSASGRICELLAAADLMARGWKVYFPLNGHGPHDLVACKKENLKTFEVRAARRTNSGALRFVKDKTMRSDHYAIVVKGEPIQYQPDLSG